MRSPGRKYLEILTFLILLLVLSGCPKSPASIPSTTSAAKALPGSLSPGVSGDVTKGAGANEPRVTSLTPSIASTATPSPAPPGPTAGARTAVPPSPKEFVSTGTLKDIYFDFDRWDITPAAAKTLKENAGWLKANPRHLLLIEGHCDERGTSEYNLALGERRAAAARTFLVSLGIGVGRITTISYGEERPVCTEKSEPCWAQTRRAHFLAKAD